MVTSSQRTNAALIATTAAVVSLVLLVLTISGPKYFAGLLSDSIVHIAAISVVAGIARFLFKRGGLLVSVAFGAAIAASGFLFFLFRAAANI
jgi:hypothetical protein